MKHLSLPSFIPHPALIGAHAQTIIGAYLPGRRFPYRAKRHLVEVSGGDRIVLHEDKPPDWHEGDKIAVLIHGLAGSYASPYMVRTAGKLNERGVRTFRLDVRGCGDSLEHTTQPGHAGRSDDITVAIEYLARQAPGSPVSLIGFSLGGNMSLKLAGEHGDAPPGNLQQVISVAPPVDLMACARNIWRKPNRRYDRSLVKRLLRIVRTHRHRVPAWQEIRFSPAPRRLYDFDHVFTAPISGFKSVEDYYERASACSLLPAIGVPTIILASADDPLVPVTSFENATFSPTTQVHLTEHGGHMGYVGHKNGDPDRRWMEWRIVQWVTETMPAESNGHPQKQAEQVP